ncbi:hypothetical protein [Azotobacter salinestris]|uniref:hypothetical protein n=1 Tax=Azotobacter salinestris TaxID=69964 RepID=UPI001266B1DF|nr:hypothetical protein [Azotobacter salinestris]
MSNHEIRTCQVPEAHDASPQRFFQNDRKRPSTIPCHTSHEQSIDFARKLRPPSGDIIARTAIVNDCRYGKEFSYGYAFREARRKQTTPSLIMNGQKQEIPRSYLLGRTTTAKHITAQTGEFNNFDEKNSTAQGKVGKSRQNLLKA